MQQKVISIDEFRPQFTAQAYKYIGLFSPTDETIINYNNGQKKSNVRLKEIEKRMESKALPDGIYMIKCKDLVQKSCVPDVYYIGKGEIDIEKHQTIFMDGNNGQKGKAENVLTYSEALRTNTDLAAVNLENGQLKKQIEKLEGENELLQTQLDQWEEEGEGLSQSNQLLETGKTILDAISPMVEGYFANIENQRKLDYNMWMVQMKSQGLLAPNQQQEHPQQEQPKTKRYEDYAPSDLDLMRQQKPELYQFLMQDWLERLEKVDPESYAQVIKQMEAEQ